MGASRRPLLWTAGVALLCALLLFPFYWMLVTAVLPTSQVLAREPTLVPALSDISLRAFVVAFERKPLATWLANSLIVTVGATSISLVIASLAGYSLSRFRTRAQEFTGLTLLLTKMLPGSLIVIPFFIMASTFHLIDSLWALMLANAAVGVPFATWLLKGFFDGIPRDLEQAAMIDGCSHLSAFVLIIVPLARPGLAACAIYLAILSWSDFVFAKTLINDQAHWTITTGMVSFIGEHGIDWSALMAAGVISIAPMVLLFLLLEPFLVSGMTSGSQK
ncbi:MAG: carbohydrate ABC transporter permease [Betaproteobacteria bacterium]|nr:carbohydrate ABC transporter permease [Betaproteobacteria bacterium]MBK7080445.1 carbohydrate ABC transporter permease [Betaproteobacteria bacterium]MBK8688957.1 carbohydrate ABC transporter permease [Betaproteobacteria bacterium]